MGGANAQDFISLGLGEPFLTKEVRPDPTNYYGRYDLRLQVYGEMYSEYNWVQTAAWEDRPFNIDPEWGYNHGFHYDNWDIVNQGRRYKAQGADFFFQDNPNARYFKAELTLCGKRGENWYPIGTFSWGYSVKSGKIANDYFRLISLKETHLENVIRTLKYYNINW